MLGAGVPGADVLPGSGVSWEHPESLILAGAGVTEGRNWTVEEMGRIHMILNPWATGLKEGLQGLAWSRLR